MRSQLRTGEKAILEVKRHWFILVGAFISTVFWIIVVSGIGWALYHFFGLPALWVVLGTGFVNLLLAFGYFWKVLERRYNILVVTTERVIDEEGVLSRRTKETPLEKIHNIEYHQSFFGRIFGYGDVSIQSAAEQGETIVDMIMNPAKLKDTILECQRQQEARKREEEAQRYAEAVIKAQREETARTRAIEELTTEALSGPTGLKGTPTDDDRRPCPYCGGSIKRQAVICRYCKEDVEPET